MPHPVVHFEIISTNAPRLQRFYQETFGWKIDADNSLHYGLLDMGNAGRGIDGGIGAARPGIQNHVTFYIEVPELEAALAQVTTGGGTIINARMQVPDGPALAHFLDPDGNVIGLMEARIG
jgi:predicted enzyme related to lactoylglutathione lyase